MSSNISQTKVTVVHNFKIIGNKTLQEILAEIKQPNYIGPFDEIRRLHSQGKKKEANATKEKLKAFTVSGQFSGIKDEHLIHYNQLIIIDIDDQLNLNLSEVKAKVCADAHTYACFISPSGKGLKIIVPVTTSADEHESTFYAVANYYEKLLSVKVDKLCKNVSRLCFTSFDPDIYINEDVRPFTVSELSANANAFQLNLDLLANPQETNEQKPTTNNNLQILAQQNEAKKRQLHKFLTPIGAMVERIEAEPPLEMVYPGIVEGTKTIVFGTPKSGKTVWCEGMLLANAAGMELYLGQAIKFKNRRSLLISLEEHPKYRTVRNAKQLRRLTPDQLAAVRENYIVVNEGMPIYISSQEDWRLLADVIKSADPGVVAIDSLNHLYQGSIEESSVAKQVTEKLRWLSEETGTTILIIHHTHKLNGRPLSMDTMAGSRILAQDVDTLIGINRTTNGTHYLKEVASRYAPCNSETVKTFTIGNDGWLTVTGEADEMRLVAALDGRRDDANADKVHEFLLLQREEGHETTEYSAIDSALVSTGIMSKQTAHSCLAKLLKEDKIEKPSKGVYKVVA